MPNDSTRRILRSATKQRSHLELAAPPEVPPTTSSARKTSSARPAPAPAPGKHAITIIPRGSKLPNLSPAELALLRKKQLRLSQDIPNLQGAVSGPRLRNALAASLIFAQHEAGTAVCIHPAGWLITCAHCFGDTEEEYRSSAKTRWLLLYDGRAVQVECHVWDMKRDLALLKIIAVESDDTSAIMNDRNSDDNHNRGGSFSYVTLASCTPAVDTPIICIGQPGSEDLESTTDRKTDYGLVEISHGAFRGMIPGADPCDNSEIGTLKHDAWTYWGHSGAPLLNKKDGTLIGLHSSWDDQTGTRHGVPLFAIEIFLREHVPVMGGELAGQRGSMSLADCLKEGRKKGLAQNLVARPKRGVQVPREKRSVDVIVISSESSDGCDGEKL
ncbi:hypothetical protein GX51_01645 [Blastomyces parvus]|uniref:AT hook domain-containing protein family protein n=1 Tax=Blastomyces parvus TaxID=2060905 RepID=A0A2B7XER0_9EURO|nr:hypothetical protein GX51_01645 [Blastomyces parvus]